MRTKSASLSEEEIIFIGQKVIFIMNKAYFGLPEKVIFCKHCVISNQRPSSSVEFKHKQNEKKRLSALMKRGYVTPAGSTR